MNNKRIFGRIDNIDIYSFTLENKYLKIEILNFAGIIQSWIVKKHNIDIVLGYNTLEEYILDDSYFGAIIGRVANIIENGTFVLNGEKYKLTKNNGIHINHGGISGFNKKIRNIVKISKKQLKLSDYSVDREEGFPCG